MKIIFNPYYTGLAYLSKSMWDSVAVGYAALLEQLLMRAGMPQKVADEEGKQPDGRIDIYSKALEAKGKHIFSDSLKADSKGTVKQLLNWRDTLVMAGWTAEHTKDAQSEKLRIIAECDETLKDYPSRADRWREVLERLQSGKRILNEDDSIEVRIPRKLICPLVLSVLDLLTNVTFAMEDLDESLVPQGHDCTVVPLHEQYEAWQLLPLLPYDAGTMLVCADEQRLQDTMEALGGHDWRTDRAGCPHSSATIFDQVDVPDKLIWLDCAGNGQRVNPYAFLTAIDIEELRKHGVDIPEAEEQNATETRWLYTLLNRTHEWILVTPKCNLGEFLGEHTVITSLSKSDIYAAACQKCEQFALPLTDQQEITELKPIGEIINITPKNMAKIVPPTDSYSTINTLVNTPFDYVLGNLGGLAAPEDDKEPADSMIKGTIAHKVVELLVNKPNANDAYSLPEIKQRLADQFDGILKRALEEEQQCKEFLNKDENKNIFVVFQTELRQSIVKLFDIIEEHKLSPIRCEYEFDTQFAPFNNPHGYIDMLLSNEEGQLVIFDMKWSPSDKYAKALEKGEAYQLYMYQHAVEAQMENKTVAWYAYYLFPLMKLYSSTTDTTPKWNEWLTARNERISELKEGVVVYDAKKDEYPKHLILKNLNIK